MGRCTALAQILTESNLNVELILHSDGTANTENSDYAIHVSDWKNPEILNNLIKKNAHFAFVDSYLAEKEIYGIIQGKVQLIAIDDTNRISYPKDSIILNPGFGGNYIDYSRDKAKVLSGADFVLLRKPFRQKFLIPEIREKIESVLITVGGDDKLNLTPKILDWLNHNYPQWKKQILIGPAFKNIEEISSIQGKNTFFHKNLDATAIRDLMLSVDLAITAGGQTTYELARCGVPMIMIEVVSNQQGNIRGFNELGIPGLEGYKENTKFINQLSNFVEKLESFDIRHTIRKKYSQINSNRLSEWINDFICYHSEK